MAILARPLEFLGILLRRTNKKCKVCNPYYGRAPHSARPNLEDLLQCMLSTSRSLFKKNGVGDVLARGVDNNISLGACGTGGILSSVTIAFAVAESEISTSFGSCVELSAQPACYAPL